MVEGTGGGLENWGLWETGAPTTVFAAIWDLLLFLRLVPLVFPGPPLYSSPFSLVFPLCLTQTHTHIWLLAILEKGWKVQVKVEK